MTSAAGGSDDSAAERLSTDRGSSDSDDRQEGGFSEGGDRRQGPWTGGPRRKGRRRDGRWTALPRPKPRAEEPDAQTWASVLRRLDALEDENGGRWAASRLNCML